MSEKEEKKPWYEAIKDRLGQLEIDVAYMRGTLDEMKRHNGRVIKVLATIITALLGIIGYLVSK